MFWQTTRFQIDLTRPRIMGIVNVTPDSFSDGGRLPDLVTAVHHCEQLLKEGADILDIGGESTRPGAPSVPLEEELARVLPLLRAAVKLNVPISVDTSKPEVMLAALDMGADIVNDVWALRRGEAAQAIARHPACGICLMHMHGDPVTMQSKAMDGDALPQVRDFLAQAVQRLRLLGVARDRIVLDPGIGFGKTVMQNFSLLARESELLELGYPLLVGWSRKSSLGAVTTMQGRSLPPAERLSASVAAALLAIDRGAAVVRVHDVRETVQALKVWSAVQEAQTSIRQTRPSAD